MAPDSQAHAGAAQSRALLSRARHGGGGQGACSTSRSPTSSAADDVTGTVLKAVANVMLRPARRGAQGSVQSAASATSSTRRSGARSPMPARANGRSAQAAFKNVDGAIARAADRAAAHGAARGAARRDRGARFHRRRPTSSTNSRRIGVPPELEPVDRRADRPPGRRPGPQRGRARQLSAPPRLRATGAPPRKGACARSCCATRIGDMPRKDAIDGARDAHHDLARRRDRGRRRSSCWRISTPRTTAIATPSTSCARR